MPARLFAPRWWPTWLGLGTLWLLTQLPQAWRHGIVRPIAALAWRVNHKRRQIVLVNLARCFPEYSEIEREALGRRHFQAVARSFIDIGLIWFARERRLARHVDLEGWEHFQRARAEGRNIILHVAHSVALDFGAVAIGRQEAGVGPYNEARNPVIDWWLAYGRRRPGNEVFERDDGMLAYTRALKSGTYLFTLTDEDFGREASVFAPFFGQPKATLPIVSRLARLANAVVLPVMTYFDAERGVYLTRISAPLSSFPTRNPVRDATQLNRALEAMILRAPEEYMWTLRLFKTQPDGRAVYQPPRDAAARPDPPDTELEPHSDSADPRRDEI
ncbi:MAG: lysophospholipid acyltransferase family protein [Thiotrichales bacterium]